MSWSKSDEQLYANMHEYIKKTSYISPIMNCPSHKTQWLSWMLLWCCFIYDCLAFIFCHAAVLTKNKFMWSLLGHVQTVYTVRKDKVRCMIEKNNFCYFNFALVSPFRPGRCTSQLPGWSLMDWWMSWWINPNNVPKQQTERYRKACIRNI